MIVGLTIFPYSGVGVQWFSNGAHQNMACLWLLLRAAGHSVHMINAGHADAPQPEGMPRELADLKLVKMGEVIDSLDVLIEGSGQVSAEDVSTVRARGGKAVTFKFGHALAIDAERAIHDKPAGAIFNGARFDEVWTTTQHEATNGSYWETLYRCPVRVLPHIWHSAFVDQMAESLPKQLPRAYQPGRKPKRIVILEPNINLVKTAHVPMVICERAFRRRPELFESVLVTNAIQLRHRLPFETFVGALDIAKPRDGQGAVMSFEARYRTPWIMAAHGDIAVSHQWVAVPNYSHYDLMRMGYPIVHNVPGMPGYRYDGFDARGGENALLSAMLDEGIEEYHRASATFLRTVDALAPVNVGAHSWALRELCEGVAPCFR